MTTVQGQDVSIAYYYYLISKTTGLSRENSKKMIDTVAICFKLAYVRAARIHVSKSRFETSLFIAHYLIKNVEHCRDLRV